MAVSPAVPGRATPGFDTPGDPGPGIRPPGWPLTSGPVIQPLSQPAGVRVIWVRAGNVQASQIPLPAPVVTPAPVYPLTQPARAKLPPGPPEAGSASGQQAGNSFTGHCGRVFCGPGAPVRNPSSGPPVKPLTSPVCARKPLPPRGRVYGNPGGPVRNPVALISRALTQPVRAPVSPSFSRGRGYGSRGCPATHAGPVFRPFTAPVAVRHATEVSGYALTMTSLPGPVFPALPPSPVPLTQPARSPIAPPSRGRVYGNAGAPVRNPVQGPPVRPLTSPVQARKPLFLLGRAGSRPGASVVHAGPPFYPLNRPARAVIPARVRALPPYGSKGVPAVHAGPPLRPLTAPVAARYLPPLRGRTVVTTARAAAPPYVAARAYPLSQPARARIFPPLRGVTLTMGMLPGIPLPAAPAAPLYPLTQPSRSRILPPPRGRCYSSIRGQVRNPSAGPRLYPLTQPVRARQPLPRHGRAYVTIAALPVQLPFVAARVYPLTQPVTARRLASAPGRAATMAMLPVPVTPVTSGPPFPALHAPVRARQPLPPRGRTTSTPAYQPPVISGEGTPQQPLAYPAGVRVIFTRIGSGAGSAGAPVRNPVTALAVFYPLHAPVQARRPLPAPGRAATMGALPAPVVPGTGPVLYPLTQPARARQPLPPRGRVSGNAGAPVRNPAPPPVITVPPLRGPFRARLPVPVLPGRAATMAALPAPVIPVVTLAVFYPAAQAIRGKPATFSKGRGSGSRGAPVHNPPPPAPVYALTQPARSHIVLPPRGHAYGSPRTPVVHAGPVTYPLTGPVRARLPQLQPRAGRAYGNLGAPAVHLGPAFRQATAPVRAPVPPVFSKGRSASNPGTPPVHEGPVFRLPAQPARAPVPPPFSKGRAAFTPRGIVVNPVTPVYPQVKALHAQPAVFLKGRAALNPGAPVRNPGHGPAPKPLTSPVRAVIPQVFSQGRAHATPPYVPAVPVFYLAVTWIFDAPRQKWVYGSAADRWQQGRPEAGPGTGPVNPAVITSSS